MRTLFLACFMVSLAAGSACASPILAGPDYFVTLPGTFITIGGVRVNLMGIVGPTGADTIVQRLSTIDIPDNPVGGMATVGAVFSLLNLTGVDPACPQGIGACNVFLQLDPVDPSTGSLTFIQTVAGEAMVSPTCSIGTAAGLPCEGTFTSFFDIFVDLTFTDLNGAPLPCDPAGDVKGHGCEIGPLRLTGSGSWTDDNGPLFVVGGVVDEFEQQPGATEHKGRQILPLPEPGSMALFGTGLSLAGLAGLWRRRRDSRG